jgi:secreted trypsin-like serine protease
MCVVQAAPAFAITFGEPDGNGHPNVGSIVLRVPEQGLVQLCSGTLIAPTVFLTASHCTIVLDELAITNPEIDVLVTFDPSIAENNTFYTGTWYTNPAFMAGNGQSDPGDVGVIVLNQAPPITPARLPSAGMLDELQASHGLKDTRFTAVGYGTVRDSKKKGFAAIIGNLDRNRSEQGYLSLTEAWLTLSMNVSTGSGGTCYGDSGGPHFIYINGAETNIVASITITGDAPCRATDKTYRMDSGAARAFLRQIVTLP